MAGDSEFDEIELELDLAYNEFDDEFQETNQQTIKQNKNSVHSYAHVTKGLENVPNEFDVSATSKNELVPQQNPSERVVNYKELKLSQLGQTDSEEGELNSEDDSILACEAERIQPDKVFQKNEAGIDVLSTIGGNSTLADNIAEDEDLAMDIDEDQLLESEDETERKIEEKKKPKENEGTC